MQFANYLTKSRHGIWYYRWVVPARIRAKHPSLPQTLKRSTKTADIRVARVRARKFHVSLALPYMNSDELNQLISDAKRQAFRVAIDPATGRVEVEAEPHETEAALAVVEHLQTLLNNRINKTFAELSAQAPQASASAAPGPMSAQSPTISKAFADWAEDQVNDNVWSKETCAYTHEPSNRLFRELVGEPTGPRENGSPADSPIIDLELARLTPARMTDFVKEFRSYPQQQGRRKGATTARDVLQQGGVVQTQENFYKRLGHVRLFIAFCVEKSWVDGQVLKELDIVLAKDTARSRAKRRAAKATSDEVVSDGYLPFTDNELKLLFGPEFKRHVQRHRSRAAATYWIPLISLHAGTRVAEASALEVSDFPVRQGVQCIRIIDHEPLSSGVGSSRMKTPSSRRAIPLHPSLIELGLLRYVEERRQAGHRHLWDGLNWEDKSGYGRYPSSDFGKLARAVGVHVPRRKVLHSFRSTCSQALDRAGMSAEHADRFLGHDVDNTRVTNYGRGPDGEAALPLELMHRQIAAVFFPIAVEPWSAVAPARRAKLVRQVATTPVAKRRALTQLKQAIKS